MPSTKPEDLESRVPLLMGVLIGMGTASTIAVALRFLARARILRNIGSDDWTMLIALVFAILTSVTGTIAASYGMGRHIVSLEPWQIMKGLKFVWFARIFTQSSFGFVKLAIALLYLRVFSVSRSYVLFIYGTIAFNFIVTTIWGVMTIKCIPASANWDTSRLPTAKCINNPDSVSHLVSHSVLDVTYVILPMLLIWNLRVPARAKAGLCILLSLGLFAAVCSMIKISKTAQLGKTDDITWEFTDLSIWNVAELNVGIIVGSIPPMRPLLSCVYRHTSDAVGLSSLSHSRHNVTTGTVGTRRSKYIMQNDSRAYVLENRSYVEGGMSKQTSKTLRQDGTSEEFILNPNGRDIVQTRVVEVSSVYEPSQHEQDIGIAKS
ncbi:hypothetical protein DL98DRAFT_637722 [Cadophora sp. DSE1049]|nr:hypothetical protein DL98DRAFT_637722 [Cadophora sp. DSE1049]